MDLKELFALNFNLSNQQRSQVLSSKISSQEREEKSSQDISVKAEPLMGGQQTLY